MKGVKGNWLQRNSFSLKWSIIKQNGINKKYQKQAFF